MVTYFLVLSVCLQFVFQSSSEVAGHKRIWEQSGTCTLHGLIYGILNNSFNQILSFQGADANFKSLSYSHLRQESC